MIDATFWTINFIFCRIFILSKSHNAFVNITDWLLLKIMAYTPLAVHKKSNECYDSLPFDLLLAVLFGTTFGTYVNVLGHSNGWDVYDFFHCIGTNLD